MPSKSAKSVAKTPQLRSEPQPPTKAGRERRPSDKVSTQLLEKREADLLKAQKAERRALREKKAVQKAKQLANLPSDGEGEYEHRESPKFVSREVGNRPSQISLNQRSGKVPPAPTPTSRSPQLEIDEGQSQRHSVQPLQPQRSRTPINDPEASSLLGSPAKSVTSIRSSEAETPPRVTQTKRVHDVISDSDDEDKVFEAHVRVSKAQKITSNTGRPKAADYEAAAREVILSAANTYRALLVTQGAFPTSSEELELVKKSWKRVNDDSEMDAMSLTPDIVRIIKARGSQARGEAKTKTASLVEALYGFDSGHSKKVIAENRKKAEELKSDKGFVFKVLSDSDGKRKGIYKHPIIQKAINMMWFKNKRDEGLVYPDLFKPMSVHSIALILTAIECNIDEWISGTKTEVTFWADDYRAIYDSHRNSLTSFGAYSKSNGVDLLDLLQRKLGNYGRLHAGVSTLSGNVIREAIPQSAFKEAVDDYVENSETDDDGSMIEA